MPYPLATSVVYKNPNINVTISKNAVRWTAVFPSGINVCQVSVGTFLPDDLVIVSQLGQNTTTGKIKEASGLRTTGDNSGVVVFMASDGGNMNADVPFEFSILRNG